MVEVDMIITGGTVVTVDKERRVIKNGAVAIEGNRIAFVGKMAEVEQKYKAEKKIDARGKAVFPGFINAHTHMFQVLLRNLATDMVLLEWLKRSIWPMLFSMRERDVYVSSLLGCLENIRSGVTCVVDNHYGGRYYDEVVNAMMESGVRGCVPRGGYEVNAMEGLLEDRDRILSDTERLIKQWHGAANGMIMIGVAPMHPCFASREFLIKAKELSDKYGVVYHTHTGESKRDQELNLAYHGKTDVELLNELGILSARYHAVHAVWVSQHEVGMLAKAGAHAIHNPVSNMYLGSGVAPVPEMLAAGVNVALGTDGPASNNNQDIIQSMKFAACLHKVNKLDPAIISAKQVLEMATLGGARALGLEHEIGSLEAGKKADITIVDMQRPHIAPVHDPVASLVYCANCGDVDTVIIDGRVVMEGGEVKTVNELEILRKSYEVVEGLKERARQRFGISFEF
jgi:5-methylthioadenosine/S-adenosylhomocysteine deaminase